jgi:hypothetical protein
MSSTTASNAAGKGKRMEYRKVSFDVNEIAPDAPAGEWMASIPRGKCKVQPTKEEHYPMLIVPFRLEKTAEEGPEFERALGTELSSMIVFFGEDANPRAVRLAKMRLRSLCEALDIDLDIIPKDLGDDPLNELEPLIRKLEGQKLKVWTVLDQRKDTGEITTELRFADPKKVLVSKDDDDEDGGGGGGGDDDEDAPRRSKSSSKGKGKSSGGKGSRR